MLPDNDSLIVRCFKLFTKLVIGSSRTDKHLQLKFNLYHLYLLQSDYEIFKAGETLVFLRSGFMVYDGCEIFEFFDIANGTAKQFRIYDQERSDRLLNQIEKIFIDKGVDMAPGSFFPDNGCNESNYDNFKDQVEYFKDFVEGKEPIKSWFVWLEENKKLLHENLTRADQLRFKCTGYNSAKDVLKFFVIPFHESSRYQYLATPRDRPIQFEKSSPLPLP
jgi:hypothetical protein